MSKKHQRTTRDRLKAPESQDTQDDDDEEILIREKTGRLLGSVLPFQTPSFSQTQPDDQENDNDDDTSSSTDEQESFSLLVSSRHQRQWQQRKRGRAVSHQQKRDDSASSEGSQRDGLPVKNDFADLEAMLATQDEEEQKDAANNISATVNIPQKSAVGKRATDFRHPEGSGDTGSGGPTLPRGEDQNTVLEIPNNLVDGEDTGAVAQSGQFNRREETVHSKWIRRNVQEVDEGTTAEKEKSLLEKSRRFAKKQLKSSRDPRFRPPRKARGPVAVDNVKSIVGSRPTHWGASSRVRPLANAHRAQQNAKRSRPDLAAALSRRGGLSMPASLSSPTPKRTRNAQQNASTITLPHGSAPGSNNDGENHHNSPTDAQEHSRTELASSESVSFAPSFVSLSMMTTNPRAARSEEEETEAVEDAGGAGSDDNVFPNPLLGSPSPSRARGRPKTSAAPLGPLSKRLNAIRDGVRGDTVRFQSGQYPFSVSSLDMNDPRNRAKTFMDVTILGNSMEHQLQRVTLLGIVHKFVQKTVTSKVETESTASSSTMSDLHPNTLAWICMAYETAREKKVGAGSQLRIYNAVPVPLTVALVHEESEMKNRSSHPVDVKWIVLCTSLCESYPSCLPKLPIIGTTVLSE